MNQDLSFLQALKGNGSVHVLVLASDHRAAFDAARLVARFESAGRGGVPKVARHLFADVGTDWSVIVKETTRADVLIVSFGKERSVPYRLRNLIDYANRMRAADFAGVVALSEGRITGETRRWLTHFAGPACRAHVRRKELYPQEELLAA